MLSIGILNILGFESFGQNDFEQFNINFANEECHSGIIFHVAGNLGDFLISGSYNRSFNSIVIRPCQNAKANLLHRHINNIVSKNSYQFFIDFFGV